MNIYSLPADDRSSGLLPFELSFETAKQLIITRARELTNELIQQRQRGAPPFLAEEFAVLAHISRIEKADVGELDAVLVRSRDGYVINVNASQRPVRQNFSCAHEIGHILLDEILRQDFVGDTEWRGGTGITDRDKERLCNVAAAELLMPALVFSRYSADFGPSIDSVERLAGIFRVSVAAAAIRVQEIGPERCRVIRWKRWQRSKSKGFIQDDTKRPARSTYVRDPSALLRAYESDDTVKSFKCFTIDKITKRCPMESKGFGRDKARYVLSLVFPDR